MMDPPSRAVIVNRRAAGGNRPLVNARNEGVRGSNPRVGSLARVSRGPLA